MSTTWDYDLPKDKRPEGSRNFPLVFPSYADMHSDENSLGGSSTPESSNRDLVISDHEVPVTRGFPVYGRAVPWLDAEYSFEKTTATVRCPEPESDGQESTTSNTPKVVLPPLTQEQHASNVHTPTHDHHQQLSYFSLGIGDPFQRHPQEEPFLHAPPGFNQQSQGRSVPGPPCRQAHAQPCGGNEPADIYDDLGYKQIVKDPRQIIVDNATFRSQYAPMQTRREQNRDFWLDEPRQAHMAASPMGTSIIPDTPMSQRSRRPHTRKLQRRRPTLAEHMARQEAARGFDSEDDNEFYPHDD